MAGPMGLEPTPSGVTGILVDAKYLILLDMTSQKVGIFCRILQPIRNQIPLSQRRKTKLGHILQRYIF